MDESDSQFLTHFKRRTGETRSDHATDRIIKCILLLCQRWTPSVGPLGGISKVDSAVLVAASKGNSERGRA